MLSNSNRYWEDIARSWRSTPQHHLWRRHSDAVNSALFSRWLPAGTEILLKTDAFDEAFGEGLFQLLASRAQTVIAMDVAVSTLREARLHHPGMQVVSADVRNLPFEDETFDIIVSNSTLDHFADERQITGSIRELYRILKTGGCLLLTIDNPLNPLLALRGLLPFTLLRRLGLVPYYVGRSLSPGRLRRELQEAGFDIGEIRAVMHCPRVLAVAAARLLSDHASASGQERYLQWLQWFERLAALPTRHLTGNFTAVKAVKAARSGPA
ncbi:MAG: methyltransferase domain-containing protein [Desulfobulbaceae bacterium]|nr:MAG: methyltransferase domain-containing protein [Desulfobulbaceae bacterium]